MIIRKKKLEKIKVEISEYYRGGGGGGVKNFGVGGYELKKA